MATIFERVKEYKFAYCKSLHEHVRIRKISEDEKGFYIFSCTTLSSRKKVDLRCADMNQFRIKDKQ